jgi:hypothetical protein
VVRLPSLRRSDQDQDQGQNQNQDPGPTTGKPATRTDERPTTRIRRRDRSADFSTKIEKAAERAAAATRTAAAAAAAERSHARPRTSALASLGLVTSVVAVLAVATGALAGLGIAVGVLALVLGLAGLAATGHRYRYLAGRGEATVAVLLSLGAIVVGILAVAGELSWLDTGTDQVARLRDELPSWLT